MTAMEYAIELPAENVPFSQDQLLKALTSATSGNPQQVQACTAQLQEWETKEGFYSQLQVSRYH